MTFLMPTATAAVAAAMARTAALSALSCFSAWTALSAAEYRLANDIVIVTDERDDTFGGITTVRRDGILLSSSDSRLVPLITWEWGDTPWVADRMGPATVTASPEQLTITAPLLASHSETVLRATYVYRGDLAAAKASPNLPSALADQRETANAAAAELATLIRQHERVVQLYERRAQWEREAAGDDQRTARRATNQLNKWDRTLAKAEGKARSELLASSQQAQALQATIDTFKAALSPYAIEHHGSIHRDFYRFPILQQADTISTDQRAADASYQPIGSITWHIAPVTRTIAGWTWQGIALHYDIALDEGYQTNVFRQAATWEIHGEAVGTGIAALRYRGLGGAEMVFTEHADGAGVDQAFSTTEVIPGHVGSAPLVSPIVPVSTAVNDRGFALRHRVGAWIARMARGAGANVVDWIWKDRTIVASYRERQGNFRAVAEAMPGDQRISFLDEEYLPLSRTFSTEPQLLLTLQHAEAWPIHEVRTRWQEVDEYVRDLVADELGFQRHRVLPGVGLLSDHSWANVWTSIANRTAETWAANGVKLMAYHNPGWINGRHQGPGGPDDTGGGVCDIYDWVPAADIAEPWAAGYQAMAEHGIAYLPWVGQTVWHDQAFVTRLGDDQALWSLNGPNDEFGPGYGRTARKGNIYHPDFHQAFTESLETARDDYGFDGYWIDSFQNLMMSQLAWGDGSGNGQQRGWWQWLADRSQENVIVMAESHAYPGLSCSIEAAALTDPAAAYYFKEVWRWIRGYEWDQHTPSEWDTFGFQILANRGWLAPDVSNDMGNMRIPSFRRYAAILSMVRDDMDRSFVLSDGRGVLWLTDANDNHGVLFAFIDQSLPEGISATQLPTDTNATNASALQAYRVAGSTLPTAFGMRTPDTASR